MFRINKFIYINLTVICCVGTIILFKKSNFLKQITYKSDKSQYLFKYLKEETQKKSDLEALPKRLKKLLPPKKKPFNYAWSLKSCVNKYSEQWKKDQGSSYLALKSLGHFQSSPHLSAGPQCWLEERNAEIVRIEQQLIDKLAQIQNKLKKVSFFSDQNEKIFDDLKQISELHLQTQEALSECRLNDLVRKAGEFQIVSQDLDADKAILHVMGDVFGKESGLEGQDSKQYIHLLSQRKKILAILSDQLKKQTYIQDERQADPCFDIGDGYFSAQEDRPRPFPDISSKVIDQITEKLLIAIELEAASADSLESFYRSLSKQIDHLKREGDYFYYISGSVKHAIISLIQKEKGTTYKFRIYNSGDGVKYHEQDVKSSTSKYFPYIVRRGVKREELTNLSFLKSIRDLHIQKFEPHNSNIENLYNVIIRNLGYPPEHQEFDRDKCLNSQIAGNCSYFVVPYTESSILDDSIKIKHVEFFVKSVFIDQYIRKNDERFLKLDYALRVAAKILTFYAEEIAKNISSLAESENHYLDYGMARESASRIDHYKTVLSEVLTKRQRGIADSAAHLTSIDLSEIPQITLKGIKSEEHALIEPIEFKGSADQPKLDFQKWEETIAQFNPQELNQNLDEILRILSPKESDQKSHWIRILSGIPNLVQKIPLKPSFFENFTRDQLKKFIGHLNKLSQFQFWALIMSQSQITGNYQSISTISILTQIRLLTVADLATRTFAKSHKDFFLVDFPRLDFPILQKFLQDQGDFQWISTLSIQDYSWSETFRELVNYWTPNFNQPNPIAFQWERFPLYMSGKNWSSSTFVRKIYLNDQEYKKDFHWSKPYGAPGEITWNDINWLCTKLRLTDDKLEACVSVLSNSYAHVNLSVKEDLRRAGALFDDMTEYFEIRDVSFLTYYLLNGSFDPELLRVTQIADLVNKAMVAKQSSLKPIFFNVGRAPGEKVIYNRYEIFGTEPCINDELIIKPGSNYQLLKMRESIDVYSGNPFQSLIRSGFEKWSSVLNREELFNPDETNGSYKTIISYGKRLTDFEILSTLQNKDETKMFSHFSLERLRQLLSLSNPLEIIAFFKENSHLFGQKEYQQLFKSLLYQPELLSNEIKLSLTLPKLLSDFYWSNFEIRLENFDFTVANFFLQQHSLLEEQLRFLERTQDIPENRKARQGFQRVLSFLNEISDVKHQTYRNFLRTFKYEDFSNLSEQDLVSYLVAIFYRDLNPLQNPSENYDIEEEHEVLGIYQNKRSSFEFALNKFSQDQRSRIFNELISSLLGKNTAYEWESIADDLSQEKWKGTFSDEVIRLNLSQPMVLFGEVVPKALPQRIYQHPKFLKFVQADEHQSRSVFLGNNRYEVQDMRGHPVRLEIGEGEDGSVTISNIQKKWGGHWYQLLDDELVNRRAVNPSEEEAKEDWSLMPGFVNWESIRQVKKDLSPPAPDAYHSNSDSIWGEGMDDQSLLSSDHYTEVLSFDPVEQKLFSVSRRSPSAVKVQRVTYQNNEAWVDGTTLLPLAQSLDPESPFPLKINFLSHIEVPRFIWVWLNPQGKIEQIDLPRFGISFRCSEGKWTSPELDSYSLASEQKIPESGARWDHFSRFIVLEKNGKFRIGIPKMEPVPIEPTEKSKEDGRGLISKWQFNWYSRSESEKQRNPEAIHSYGKNSQKLLLWDLNPNDHHFMVKGSEDRFFLSLIHLWINSFDQSSYDQARELLYGSRSYMGDFRAEPTSQSLNGALEILNWFFRGKNNDFDPRAVALRLGAATLIIENELLNNRVVTFIDSNGSQDKKLTVSEFLSNHLKQIIELYELYLNTREKISTRWFPEDLEQFLLHSLIPVSKFPFVYQLNNRLSELQSLSSVVKSISFRSMGVGSRGKYLPLDNFVRMFNRYWLERYSEITSSNKNEKPSNFYHKISVPFEELFSLAIQLDQIDESTFTKLIHQLSRLYDVSENTIKYKDESLTVERSLSELKEQFLDFFKYLIKLDAYFSSGSLNSDYCDLAKLIYGLASCSGDRSELRRLTLVDKNLNIKKLDEHYALGSDIYDAKIRGALQKAGFDQLDQSFLIPLDQTRLIRYIGILDLFKRTKKVGAVYHWDERTETIPKEGFSYQYDSNQEIKKSMVDDLFEFDLYRNPVIKKANLENYIAESRLDDSAKSTFLEDTRNLLAIFTVPTKQSSLENSILTPNRLIEKKFAQIQDSIAEKIEHDTSTPQSYHWKNEHSAREIKNISNDLERKLNRAREIASDLKSQIERGIKSFPKESSAKFKDFLKIKHELLQTANIQIIPKINHLLHIYASRDFEKIFILNLGLDRSLATEIYDKLTLFLLHSTYAFQAERTLKLLRGLSEQSSEEELRYFFQTATATRQFELQEYPDFLVFEYFMEIMIREDQMKNLERLVSEKSTLFEMIMGAGKTSVLLPLASHRNAVSGKKLSLVVLPESLIPSVSKQLALQLERVFNQGIDQISIQRRNKYDSKKLQSLYLRLR